MKKLLLLFALLLASAAHATTAPPGAVAKMVAASELYMNCDICQVANQRLTATGAFAQFYVKGVGLVKVPADQYNVIADAGKLVGTSGLFRMSEVVQENCEDDWDGGVCRAARFLWDWKDWPKLTECVMPNGKIYKVARPPDSP